MLTPDQYAEQHTSQLDTLLQEILDYTLANHPHPHMISGHVQGQFLRLFSQSLRPLRILEIGTFTGFSALCLASGLPENGMLHTLELRAEDAALSQSYFDRSIYKDKIKIHIGEAAATLSALQEPWDLVFIDADKTGYTGYYEQVLPHVKQGGLILADNVLFHGEVLQETLKGKNARAIAAFNTHVMQDNRVEQVLLTVRDGLLMIRKK